MMRYKRRKIWNEIFNITQKGETKMGIEDHIRDIIREKVNERIDRETSVLRRRTIKEIGDLVRYEMKAHEHRCHRHEEENPHKTEPLNHGAGWNDVEDEQLRKELGFAITWMATMHSRTNGAIRARLQKHAKDSFLESYV